MARKSRVEIVAEGVRIERVRARSLRTLGRRLWPALAVIALASGISLHRLRIDNWQGLGPIGWKWTSNKDRREVTAKSRMAAPGHVLIRERASRPSTIAPRTTKPIVIAKAEEPKAESNGEEPFVDRAELTTPPEALREIDPNELRDRIRQEAEEKRRELAHASSFKREVAGWMKRDEARYDRERDRKLHAAADEDRDNFFELLRNAIRLPDDQAALAIVQACAAHKGEVGKGTTARLRKILETGNVRGLSIHERIRLFRSIGIPEPYILGEIARSQADRVGQRGGPRSKAQVIVNAASSLLDEKPRKSRSAIARAQPEQ